MKEEYNRISACQSAKEMLEMIAITHETTQQVKKERIDILVHKYEMFRMIEGESIRKMHNRFNDIVNPLIQLGKTYTQPELVKKILRSLTYEFSTKATAIREAKDLNQMRVQDLIGSLTTYELEMDSMKQKYKEKAK